MALPLFAAKAQPDEVERSAHADQETNQGEVGGVKEVVRRPADATPEEEA